MKNKIFWFDVETSGLDAKENDILTLSGLIEIDGRIQDKINLQMQPFNYDNISPEALEVNGLTLDQIKTFDEPKVAHKKLVAFFDKYVNRYDKTDKFLPAGYNVAFDTNFLAEFFKKCGDNYYGSWIDYHRLDVAGIVLWLKVQGLFDFYGYKLEQVSDILGIQIDAHDAESDIIATRKVFKKLTSMIEIKKDG